MTHRLVKRMPMDLPWWRDAANAYRRGASLRSIAREMGVSHEAVRQALGLQEVNYASGAGP